MLEAGKGHLAGWLRGEGEEKSGSKYAGSTLVGCWSSLSLSSSSVKLRVRVVSI